VVDRSINPREFQFAWRWMPGTGGQVLHFTRPGGWRSLTNFGPGPVTLPHGRVIVSSSPLEDHQLPADTTAWILNGG
jgi:alpha-glucosidase